MSDICTDNRFELIEKFKKELIESTNIETSPEEMNVLDNILFRFWQMGWLDSIDRMLLVKESAKTLMHSVGDSVSAKAFRNAGRFIQNAIDGEAPELEKIPSAQPEQQWIPVSEGLPERPYGCFVTVWDTNPATLDEFENILPYFVGWDGEQWNDADGEQCPFEAIAWMPLPEPYSERREEGEG